MKTTLPQKVFFTGKLSDYIRSKGWFFGHFMEEKLLKSDLVEVAWQNISNKKPAANDKHYHKNSVEINVIISGSMTVQIDGKRVTLNKGEFYVVYPYAKVESVTALNNTELMVIRAPSLVNDKFST